MDPPVVVFQFRHKSVCRDVLVLEVAAGCGEVGEECIFQSRHRGSE